VVFSHSTVIHAATVAPGRERRVARRGARAPPPV